AGRHLEARHVGHQQDGAGLHLVEVDLRVERLERCDRLFRLLRAEVGLEQQRVQRLGVGGFLDGDAAHGFYPSSDKPSAADQAGMFKLSQVAVGCPGVGPGGTNPTMAALVMLPSTAAFLALIRIDASPPSTRLAWTIATSESMSTAIEMGD